MVWNTGKSSFDTGERSRILVNPVLIQVKTSGILVSGLGYWLIPFLILVSSLGYW